MPEGDRQGDGLRVPGGWETLRRPYKLSEQVVDVQLFEKNCEETTVPG